MSFLGKQGNSTLPLELILRDNATGPENQCIAQMEQQEIQQAIDALEEPDRSILVRRYYYCQKGPQIALETGLTEKAVEHRLAKGRRKLHAALLKKGVTP